MTGYIDRDFDDERGYTFLGYSTNPDATEAEYALGEEDYPGATNVLVSAGQTNMTLYAVWRADIQLTLDANGGEFDSGETSTVFYRQPGAEVALDSTDTAERRGFVFLGYSTNPNATEAEYPYVEHEFKEEVSFDEDTTLYAVWAPRPTVTLDANGGVFGNDDSAPATRALVDEYGYGSVDLDDAGGPPMREGYMFLGYASAADAEQAEYAYDWGEREYSKYMVRFTQSFTLFAVWQKVPTVTLHFNDGTDGKRVMTASWSDYINAVAIGKYGTIYDVPERDGYFFNGWATSPDATVPDERWSEGFGLRLGALTEDLEFYAIWGKTVTDAKLVPAHGALVQGEDFELHRSAFFETGYALGERVVFKNLPAPGDMLELTYGDGEKRSATYGGERFCFDDGEEIPYSFTLRGNDGLEKVQWQWPGEYNADGSIKSLQYGVVDQREISFELFGSDMDKTFTQSVDVKWDGQPVLDLSFWDNTKGATNMAGYPLFKHPGETIAESEIPTELKAPEYAGSNEHRVCSWGVDTGKFAATTGAHEPSWYYTHPVTDAMSFMQVATTEPCSYEYKVTKAATATAAGKRVGTCKVCGHEVAETIPATGPAAVAVGKTTTVATGGTKATYRVTKAASASAVPQVAYMKPKGSAKAAVIPDAVEIDGVKCAVTSVAANAFKGSSVTSVQLGANVATVETAAFQNCKKLKSVVVGAKVTKIGKKAFSGCKSLKKVTIKSKKLKSVGKQAFKGTAAKLKIKVPKAQKKKYAKLFKKAGIGKKAKVS